MRTKFAKSQLRSYPLPTTSTHLRQQSPSRVNGHYYHLARQRTATCWPNLSSMFSFFSFFFFPLSAIITSSSTRVHPHPPPVPIRAHPHSSPVTPTHAHQSIHPTRVHHRVQHSRITGADLGRSSAFHFVCRPLRIIRNALLVPARVRRVRWAFKPLWLAHVQSCTSSR